VIAAALGLTLIALSINLLSKTIDRSDYRFFVGVIGGFFIFVVGFYIFCSLFLPIPL
jgi:hypothetical protein